MAILLAGFSSTFDGAFGPAETVAVATEAASLAGGAIVSLPTGSSPIGNGPS